MGDGSTVRSLLFAGDFAWQALAALAAAPPRAIYNVGSDQPVTLGDLAARIARHVSPTLEVRTRVGQVGHEPSRLVPSVSRIQGELHARPVVPLDMAIERSIAWHRAAGRP
jgi:dTDP-glucose 4,6-dehydratase